MSPIPQAPTRVARPALTTSVGVHAWSGPNENRLSVLLIAPLVYACLFLWLRALGAPLLLVALATLVVFGVSCGRRYFQWPLFTFAALAIVYIILSYAGALDRGLTLLFSREAIAQQCAYAVVLPFAVAAFAVYHQGVDQRRPAFVRLETLTFAMAAGAKIYDFILPTPDILSGVIERAYSGVPQLIDPVALLTFVMVRRLLDSSAPKWQKVFVAFALLISSSSAQGNISTAMLFGLLVFSRYRVLLTAGFLVAMVLAVAVELPFADYIWTIDANTGIRLFFWKDCARRVWESGGVGVGFGTETIRPVYYLTASDVSLETVDDPGFIYIGSHNGFVDALYRMGFAGFSIIALYFGSLFTKLLKAGRYVTVMDCWVISTVMTIMMVDVALSSFNLFFGTVYFLGWLVYRSTFILSMVRSSRSLPAVMSRV